jgi:hypothetical protein
MEYLKQILKVFLDFQYPTVATTGIKTFMMELAKATRKYPISRSIGFSPMILKQMQRTKLIDPPRSA